MTNNIKVGILLRVSSSSQSVDSQKLPLIDYVEKQNYELVNIYEDTISGVAKVKPARERLLEDIRKGRINKVVVFSVCRISRNTADFLKFMNELQELKCDLYIHTANLDTNSTFGRTMLSFVAIMAQFEREMLKARISEGIANRKKQGLSVGRPSSVNTGIIEAIKILKEQGIGARETMRRLNVGTKIYYQTVRNMAQVH
jgi:DNA invertase Pin-like site-specific DNA recombinase